VIGGVFKAADITLFHVATQGGGATFLDGLHDPAVRKGHRVVVAIMLAVLTEDVSQFALGSCRRLISDSRHAVGLDHLTKSIKSKRTTG